MKTVMTPSTVVDSATPPPDTAAPVSSQVYDPENPPSAKTRVDKIKTNDVMLIIQYVHVDASDSRYPSADLTDLHIENTSWKRSGREILEAMYSADQYDEEIELTNTLLIRRLMDAGKLPFTVNWIKKDGSERTLRGRLIGHADHYRGYSWVEDLDLKLSPKENRMREVDHRTLQWLIIDGKKYVLKGSRKKSRS